MINYVYYDKPLMFIRATIQEKLFSHHWVVNDEDSDKLIVSLPSSDKGAVAPLALPWCHPCSEVELFLRYLKYFN